MNKILLGTFGLLPLSASLYAQSAENQPDKRPNIIFLKSATIIQYTIKGRFMSR